jgi:hypothetical protein
MNVVLVNFESNAAISLNGGSPGHARYSNVAKTASGKVVVGLTRRNGFTLLRSGGNCVGYKKSQRVTF